MSSDPRLILKVIPSGTGVVLDLGGSKGILRRSLRARGYRYINLDLCRFGNGEPSLIGDAHWLPVKDATVDIVISKDTLHCFPEPWIVVKEVHRVLKTGGRFVIWVPFMHPSHGSDFYRYSPEGIKHLLRDFDVLVLESPLWIFSVLGLASVEVLKRVRLGFAEQPLKQLCGFLDRLSAGHRGRAASFAAAYRIVACKDACKP
jgi:SAM-dependent methyltransferase